MRPQEHRSPWKLGGLTVGQLARRVLHEVQHDEVFDRAAALSYYFVFSLFPTLLFLTTMLGLLPGNLMDTLMGYVSRVLPGDAASLIGKTLGEVARGASTSLLSVGAIAALWTASSGMGSIMTALSVAYDVQDRRPWWKWRFLAIVLTVVFAVFTMTALILLVFGPKIVDMVADFVGFGPFFTAAWTLLRWPIAVLFVLVGFALVYYLAPAAKQHWYWVTPGSLFALVGWVAMSAGLRLYVAYFGNFNTTYGSIGGVILLMLWFYLTGLVLLIGAEINAEIEHAAAMRGEPTAKASGETRAVQAS